MNYNYTIEELKLLEPIYLDTLNDKKSEELFTTNRQYNSIGTEGFIKWLSKADRTILLINTRLTIKFTDK